MTYFFNRTVINLQLGAYQTNIHHFQSKIYTFFCWIIVRKSFFFINFDFLQSTVHFFFISKNLNFCEEQYHRKKKKFSKWKTKKEKKKLTAFATDKRNSGLFFYVCLFHGGAEKFIIHMQSSLILFIL